MRSYFKRTFTWVKGGVFHKNSQPKRFRKQETSPEVFNILASIVDINHSSVLEIVSNTDIFLRCREEAFAFGHDYSPSGQKVFKDTTSKEKKASTEINPIENSRAAAERDEYNKRIKHQRRM